MLSHIILIRRTSHFSRFCRKISSWIRFGAFYEHFNYDSFIFFSSSFYSFAYFQSVCHFHTYILLFYSPLFAVILPVHGVHLYREFPKYAFFLSLRVTSYKMLFFIFRSTNKIVWLHQLCLAIKWNGSERVCVCHLGATSLFISLWDLNVHENPFMMQLKQLRLPSIFNQLNRQKLKFDLFSVAISADDGATILCAFVCCN